MFTPPFPGEKGSKTPMFGSLGIPEMIMIFIVALIVFGPKRLPEIGRTLGKALSEFKKATDDFKTTIEREVHVDEMKQLATTHLPIVDTVSRSEPAPAAPPAEQTAALGTAPPAQSE